MLLANTTWPEVKKYLEEKNVIIVPIGSAEQHGPTGFIGTDSICPEIIAKKYGEKENVMIAPTLYYGMSQHHLGFPGSVTLRPSTLMAMITDIVQSLILHGFEYILFFNGHGGNVVPVRAAFSEMYADYSLQKKSCPACLYLMSWYEGDRVAQYVEELFGDTEGSHATPSEISLSLYASSSEEGGVFKGPLTPEVAPAGSFSDAADFKSRYRDGRIGSNPLLASFETGQKLLDFAVADLADFCKENTL